MPQTLQETLAGRRRIYLVRHGEVDYFDAEKKPQPQQQVLLSERGVSQIQSLAAHLESVPFDRVISSGLPRTDATARILSNSPVDTVEDLQEILSGDIEALRSGETDTGFAELLLGALSENVTAETRFLGGERFGDFEARVVRAFRLLLVDPDWHNLLVAAHGGTNRSILLHALGSNLSAFGALEQDPGCLNIIEVDPDQSLLVRLVNFTAYEPAKHGLRLTTMETVFHNLMGPADNHRTSPTTDPC